MLDRRPTSALAGLPAATAVCVAGRIVGHGAGAALLRDASGTAELIASPPPPLYALVVACGLWNGRAIEATHCQLVHTPAVAPEELFELARAENQKHKRLAARARILREVRGFFERRGFLEVETPLAVPSPGLDLHLDAVAVHAKCGPRYLITSPEYQMKRLLTGGLEQIYQVAKCFRNDELGDLHQPEFTLLEWYRAFSDVHAVMADTEQLVSEIARAISGAPRLDSAWGAIDVAPPWPRLTVREAFRRFAGLELDPIADDEERFFRVMVEQIEPALRALGAVFLCEYPANMASLARKKPGDPRVAERFEAYLAGIELCNGFGELTDPGEQRARLAADQAVRRTRGLPVYPLDERFLSALEQGMPPSGGNALGLDRLIMLALGARRIEDVMALPASRL